MYVLALFEWQLTAGGIRHQTEKFKKSSRTYATSIEIVGDFIKMKYT